MTLNVDVLADELSAILLSGFLGFVFAMALTPVYTHFSFKYKLWKVPRTSSTDGKKATLFSKLHKKKHENGGLPTMSGVIFLIVVTVLTLLFNLSREQTYLPLIAFIGAGFVGLIDDIINVRGLRAGAEGLSTRAKFFMILLVALLGGWFFVYRLGYDSFYLTFWRPVSIGWLLMPLFAFIVVATANAVNISDGLDGLSGGLATSAYSAFGTIALLQGNYGIAGFCFTVVGILFSYVWFNIYPARFMMGDVGSFALGTALGVVAMLTDSLVLLPVIGLVFVVEAGSSFIQLASKRLRGGKKIFKIAPIHHHFEASGWPETKVTMRFWVIGQVCAIVGVMLAIVGGHI